MKKLAMVCLVGLVTAPVMANKQKKCYDDAKAAQAASIKSAQDALDPYLAKYDHAADVAKKLRDRVLTMRKQQKTHWVTFMKTPNLK
jgi:uncharacterized protein YdeI (BOF family)